MSDPVVSYESHEGSLQVNHADGIVEFVNNDGVVLLHISHLKKPIPRGFSINMASVAQLTSFAPIEDQCEFGCEPMDHGEPSALAKYAERTEGRCSTCHKIHDPTAADVAVLSPSNDTFYPGHEYIIETKTSQQKYVRRWRMGYVGRMYGSDRHHLLFSARGPDRTHSGQYGGDVVLDIRDMTGTREVPRDDAKRHIGQEVRVGGKAT